MRARPLVVPCSDLGQRYYETGSSNDLPGQLLYSCNSPLYPRLTQEVDDNGTAAQARSRFTSAIANIYTATDGWYEVASPGPAGSRAFKRSRGGGLNTQIAMLTTKWQYYVDLLLTYAPGDDGYPGFTPQWAATVLNRLLARIPG